MFAMRQDIFLQDTFLGIIFIFFIWLSVGAVYHIFPGNLIVLIVQAFCHVFRVIDRAAIHSCKIGYQVGRNLSRKGPTDVYKDFY